MKVAITKSRIYKGGVTQVLASIIQVLNEKNIIPDIITLRSDVSETSIQKNYGQTIKFNVIEIAADFKMPYEWHFLYFNLVSRPFLRRYDLIIDSNNTSFLSQNKIKSINYVHFPRKARVISEKESIHLPDGKNKSAFKFSQDPFFLAKFLYSFNTKSKSTEQVICNSEFTARIYNEIYGNDKPDLPVIYPPIQLPEKTKMEKRPKSVVTLGRFSEEKRQLEQIEIARQLPQYNFSIIGFSGDGKYLEKCQQKIKETGCTNVTLLPDITFWEIENTLRQSQYFLHNMRNEPFGISTVQAISHGCIPMVHDSGGSKEIIRNENFLFNDTSDCVLKFKQLDHKNIRELSELVEAYDLSPYSKNTFLNSFREILSNHIS